MILFYNYKDGHMNTNDVSMRTKEILSEYADILGLPPTWNQSLSINDFFICII